MKHRRIAHIKIDGKIAVPVEKKGEDIYRKIPEYYRCPLEDDPGYARMSEGDRLAMREMYWVREQQQLELFKRRAVLKFWMFTGLVGVVTLLAINVYIFASKIH